MKWQHENLREERVAGEKARQLQLKEQRGGNVGRCEIGSGDDLIWTKKTRVVNMVVGQRL